MAVSFAQNVGSAFEYGGPNSKGRLHLEGILTTTTAAHGAAKGSIPASTFGLSKLTSVSTIVHSTDILQYPGSPCYDGTSLQVGGGAANATMNLPVGSYFVIVEGVK